MRVYRICDARYAAAALTGEGARRYSGRWHHAPTAVLYTAATRSLAALEMLVNLDSNLFPDTFVTIPIKIPDDLPIDVADESRLPAGWQGFPPLRETRDMGTTWVGAAHAVALRVPSAVIPQEYLYLLDPQHPDFARLRIDDPEPFRFDPRLAS